MPLSPHWRWKIEGWKRRWLGWLYGDDREETPRPRICPACGQLAGTTARRCPNCGASLTFSLAALSRHFSRYLPEAAPATYGICFFCCLLYGICLLVTVRSGAAAGGGLWNLGGISTGTLAAFGASLPLPYNLIEPWRFVTAVFLHASLLHIGFNMWVLVTVGPMVEELYGSGRYLWLFLVTGVAGYVASSFFGHVSVGASGALLGLIGSLLAVTTRRRGSATAQMVRSQLLIWVVYIAIWGFLMPGIDNAAHAGGLVAGFLIGLVIRDRPPADMVERKVANILGWLAGAVVVASFALVAAQFLHP